MNHQNTALLSDKWSRHHSFILIGLIALMGMTRIHHFGSLTTLPDASLAVFFFAGVLLRQRWVFPLLFAEAWMIDYAVTQVGGVSDWCISPAYLFLLPTYAVLFEAGRFCSDKLVNDVRSLLQATAILIGATSLAFLISNGSFYAFSGKFEMMSYAEYISRTAQYFAPYLTTTLVYASLLTLIVLAVQSYQLRGSNEA